MAMERGLGKIQARTKPPFFSWISVCLSLVFFLYKGIFKSDVLVDILARLEYP